MTAHALGLAHVLDELGEKPVVFAGGDRAPGV
jgi:hypothetical protein